MYVCCMAKSNKIIPVHSLPPKETNISIRRIEHKNPYDFTTEHRHTYFEIFFFHNGGGKQLIDFKESKVNSNSCYIVFPHQIHLLKRDVGAHGLLLQFGEEAIPSSEVLTLLKQQFHEENAEVFFEKNKKKLENVNTILQLIQDADSNSSPLAKVKSTHFLQALLVQLIDLRDVHPTATLTDDRKLLFDFQQNLDHEYSYNHTVSKYASGLHTTEKKLALITKKYLGLTPLQVIHNRLLLEAKRLLIFENNTHKEIAFSLGFDSPASFSLFIKNKTGLTPSELIVQLAKIHK